MVEQQVWKRVEIKWPNPKLWMALAIQNHITYRNSIWLIQSDIRGRNKERRICRECTSNKCIVATIYTEK